MAGPGTPSKRGQTRKRKRIDYMAFANQQTASHPTASTSQDSLLHIRRHESLDSYARLQTLLRDNDPSESQGITSQSEQRLPSQHPEPHLAVNDINNTDSDFLPEGLSLPSWREIDLPGHGSLSLDGVDLQNGIQDMLGDDMADRGYASSEDDSEDILKRLQESEQLSQEEDARNAIVRYMCNDLTINTLRIIGWKIRTHTARESYNDLRGTLAEAFDFDSEFKALKLLTDLSHLKPIIYHCCVNSCIAYTGKYADLITCPFCREPRYFDDVKQISRYNFSYIPLIPQLKAIFANPVYREMCTYRGDHNRSPEQITDYCDSAHYLGLLNKTVEIIHEDGRRETLQHKHFSDKRDIALGLFTDGFQLFKKSRVQKSTTPILLVNLNLPPTIRTHLDHLICLGLVPGPHAPKDINSFFHPAYIELQELARGVSTMDTHLHQEFQLHAYIVFKCGDLPAVAKFLEQKGHSAVSACSACEATGVRMLAIGNVTKASSIYYFPLRPPSDHPAPQGPVWIAGHLPMRTDSRIEAQLSEIEAARTVTAKEALAKKYGLNGRSLLSRLSSVSVASTPRDVMHLLFEHMVPMMISFWKGEYKPWKAKKLDQGQPYVIPQDEWKKIGTLTINSSSTIPGSFSCALPNIYKEENLYIAETYAFWMMYLGPILLKGRWNDAAGDKYYKHAVLLSSILRRVVEYEIPVQDVSPCGNLTQDITQFVQQYYDYYYQYKNERLPACNSTLHGMLHIPDDIQSHGPSWVYWCFVMERYCGSLLPSIRSRSNPYPCLTKRMLEGIQVSQIKKLYPELKSILERPSRDYQYRGIGSDGEDLEPTTTHETVYPEFPHTILCRPHRSNFNLAPELLEKLGTHFKILFSTPDKQLMVEDVRPYVHQAQVDQWGKVRRAFGGDTIRSVVAMQGRRDNLRDTSFVRACFIETTNRGDTRVIYYGQVESFWVCHFPPSPWASDGARYILALFSPCGNTRGRDATKTMVTYKTLNRSKFVAATAIESVVGRIQTEPGRREWAIIDRSGAYASTVLTERGLPDVQLQ